MIPRIAHFVFGLTPQKRPFHFLHYVAVESCRRLLQPEAILFHHKHVPWGPWWDEIRPHLTLVDAELVPEVLAAEYSDETVPRKYAYAHHADFVRLDALLEHGGVYADIDTIFLRPFPDELFDEPFVIGRESPTSLCNALLLSEPGSAFARAWREQMPAALDGTWSNHSNSLAHELSERMPDAVRIEPEQTFYPYLATPLGLTQLFEERHSPPPETLSVHLWAHLWMARSRSDFTTVHAGACTPAKLRRTRTTLADLTRPYLPEGKRSRARERWAYISWGGYSGYAVAAARCVDALADSDLEVEWLAMPGTKNPPATDAPVVVAHIVPEVFRGIRKRNQDAFLVGHTVWETDRIPQHWHECFAETDLLVVPSSFNAEVFTAAGVSTPIAVVPHVAPRIVDRSSQTWARLPPDVLVFYTVGVWSERKAVDKTVEAYLRAFSRSDPVVLVVKTSIRDHRDPAARGRSVAGEGSTAWSLARVLAGHPDAPPVLLHTADVGHAEIGALHRRADVFVSLTRGEGWGLGAFDAAAYGNPVVITGYGGQVEYLGDSPWLVRHDLVPVHDPAGYPSYSPDQNWAEPDLDHAVELLRQIAAAPEEAKAAAKTRAGEIRERYQSAQIASRFRDAVSSCRSRAG